MTNPLTTAYEFGDFSLDAGRRLLQRRDGTPVPLTSKVFETLLCLLRQHGRVVTKETLMKTVWPDTIVEENNLTQNISALRRIFGENPGTHHYIVTVPGRGYRFVAEVTAGLTRGVSAPVAGKIRTLAVLPFKLLLPESRDAALEMGITDTLIARLGKIKEVAVRPLSSVRAFGSLEQDPVAAGLALGVESVLDGTIQHGGDRIRVVARLINVADGSSLWTDRFDEKFTDVFGVEDAISGRVAQALAIHLSPEEQEQIAKRHTGNSAAYQLYLTGRYHWSRITPPEIRKSMEYFRQAIELDPGYALPYAGLAEAYRSLPITSDIPPQDAFPQSKAAAVRALAIDDTLAEPHATLAFIHFWYDWDWAGAEREALRAIQLNPNYGFAHIAYGHLLSDLARHDEAIAEAERACEVEPVSLIVNALCGAIYYYASRFDEAVARLRRTLDLEPNFWVARLFLGKAYTEQRKYAEALEDFAQAKTISRGNSETIGMIGYVHALRRQPAKARAILATLKSAGPERYVPPVNLAVIHLGLGEIDEAFACLERAYAERDVRLSFFRVDPKWDPIRGDPRFVALLARLGL
ncbi:MAG: winged helix-turn-helix domain-containing protein [Chthoniobacterales bacterium]|nr:winged helix-turn-helix domain-containing protein [Chthoniobacterales bacterium]